MKYVFQVQSELESARKRVTQLKVALKSRGLDPSLAEPNSHFNFNRFDSHHQEQSIDHFMNDLVGMVLTTRVILSGPGMRLSASIMTRIQTTLWLKMILTLKQSQMKTLTWRKGIKGELLDCVVKKTHLYLILKIFDWKLLQSSRKQEGCYRAWNCAIESNLLYVAV